MSYSTKIIEILLIEDNIGDVLLTKKAFQSTQFKYNLRIAKDGEEALKILQQQEPFQNTPRPDMILLDLNLPKFNGREVLLSIKSNSELNDIPVIILSGSASESDITSSYDLHANSYIIKPDNFGDYKEIATSIENYWFDKKLFKKTLKTLH